MTVSQRQLFSSCLTFPGHSSVLKSLGSGLGFIWFEFRSRLVQAAQQQGYVLLAVAQGRDMDADDVQAVEQVFPEAAFGHQRFKILVGGGDNAHVHFDGGMRADRIKLAVGKHSQQPGLQLRRHVADLVKKQGAAIGLFKTPDLPAFGRR
jgi:hypothetical protein